MQVLPLLLGKLGDPGLPSELVFQCLTKMVQLMAEHTRRKHSGVVWTALLVCGTVCRLGDFLFSTVENQRGFCFYFPRGTH